MGDYPQGVQEKLVLIHQKYPEPSQSEQSIIKPYQERKASPVKSGIQGFVNQIGCISKNKGIENELKTMFEQNLKLKDTVGVVVTKLEAFT